VTESPEGLRCRWCGRGIDPRPGPGRPKEFCKPSCRQADYVARLRRTEVGLSEHELIVTREALEDLRDKIYVLEAAIEDVDRDLQEDADPSELLRWMLAAARPVAGRTLIGEAGAASGG
jgi:hypothetical protein